MTQIQRFNQLNSDLITAFRKTSNPDWAEARLLGSLQVLVPLLANDQVLSTINDALTDTLKSEVSKLLSLQSA